MSRKDGFGTGRDGTGGGEGTGHPKPSPRVVPAAAAAIAALVSQWEWRTPGERAAGGQVDSASFLPPLLEPRPRPSVGRTSGARSLARPGHRGGGKLGLFPAQLTNARAPSLSLLGAQMSR